MIVEREIDDRQVSVLHWWEAPKPHMAEWVQAGFDEAKESGEMYMFEYPGKCQLT